MNVGCTPPITVTQSGRISLAIAHMRAASGNVGVMAVVAKTSKAVRRNVSAMASQSCRSVMAS